VTRPRSDIKIEKARINSFMSQESRTFRIAAACCWALATTAFTSSKGDTSLAICNRGLNHRQFYINVIQDKNCIKISRLLKSI